jgi:hypothetical protein
MIRSSQNVTAYREGGFFSAIIEAYDLRLYVFK